MQLHRWNLCLYYGLEWGVSTWWNKCGRDELKMTKKKNLSRCFSFFVFSISSLLVSSIGASLTASTAARHALQKGSGGLVANSALVVFQTLSSWGHCLCCRSSSWRKFPSSCRRNKATKRSLLLPKEFAASALNTHNNCKVSWMELEAMILPSFRDGRDWSWQLRTDDPKKQKSNTKFLGRGAHSLLCGDFNASANVCPEWLKNQWLWAAKDSSQTSRTAS